MIRDDVLFLVNENPAAHGIFDPPAETQRMVYCRVHSVTRSEFWHAMQAGIEPELVFEISDYADYNGEKLLVYNGRRWRVVRTYVTAHTVSLTAAPATADAEKTREDPEPAPAET